jgi:hypothetical protein
VDLVSSDGHVVAFEGLRMAPRNLHMRHFLFLSIGHAREKYEAKGHFYKTSPEFAAVNWRIDFDFAQVRLPSERQLRRYDPAQPLDRSEPLTHHLAILPR